MNKRKLTISIIVLLFVCSIIIFYKSKKDITIEVDETYPYLLSPNCEILVEDSKQGMTIKDEYQNEWVWIEVPKSKVFLTAQNEEDYNNIEKDIKEYTKSYSLEEYEDNCDEEPYQKIKQRTLMSIYQYGGFWISRYEIGTDQIRNSKNAPVTEGRSQPDLYVYNYVTIKQAQEIAMKISEQSYTSNLLFGFQCDLVCKFIEENGYCKERGKITKDMIIGNSSSWGNYYSSSFEINNGKYSENNGNDYQDSSTIKQKKAYKNLLLTTGASERNKTCNIYDFAGNVSEWTLESVKYEKDWSVIRDGSFYFNYGGNDPANGRYRLDKNSSSSSYGFRVMCIK